MLRKRTPDLTAELIINGFCDRVLRGKAQNRIYPNIYFGPWEADLLEITRAGYLYEYEIKISRHDYRKEKSGKGRKYDDLISGRRVNYFSYIVPEGLVDPEEIPDWAGLIYARGYPERVWIGRDKNGGDLFEERTSIRLTTVKDPQKLRSSKITEEERGIIERKVYFRFHKIRSRLAGHKLITPFGIT